MDSNDILILKLAKSYTDAKVKEAEGVVIDKNLSETSTNPVQNKAITTEIKQTNANVEDLKVKASTVDGQIKTLTNYLATTNSNLTKTDTKAGEAKTSADRANQRIDDLSLSVVDGLLCVTY